MPAKRSQQCRYRCPCGNSCTLNGQVPHAWHICHHAACQCHAQARYGDTAHVVGWTEPVSSASDSSGEAVPA